MLLPDLRERYAIDTLEIFGSRARIGADDKSDLDILVRFSETPDLLTLVALENELSEKLPAGPRGDAARSQAPRLRRYPPRGDSGVTAGRDPGEALEDILRNMELARPFLGDSTSTDQIEKDPTTLHSVVRASRSLGKPPSACPPQTGSGFRSWCRR